MNSWLYTLVRRWHRQAEDVWRFGDGEFTVSRRLNWGTVPDSWVLRRGIQVLAKDDQTSPTHWNQARRRWACRMIRAYLREPEAFNFALHSGRTESGRG
jgi:hypothetical protein